jgi:AbiV family abortive infection protein
MPRKLYESLFLNRSKEETFPLLSDGILAFVANAERLYGDAKLLFEQGRWASGRFLLTITNEEMAKPYIFLGACRLDFSRHQSTLVQLCKAFYDPIYKYAYKNVLSNSDIQTIQDGKTLWLESVEKWIPDSESEDVKPIHETYFLLEMPLYVNFLDSDQRWSTPREDVAEYNYSMGSGIANTNSVLERLKKTQQSGLFSSSVLSLINEGFKNHYISDTTPDEVLVNLHEKSAKQIETNLGFSVVNYQESSLNTIPLYHFLAMHPYAN